ncbi:two-component system connector SafA [Escherichia coli]|nr:two-component system connector SafA [Escherichia coli]
MHATTVKNKITQRDNYKEIMSAIVVVLLLTLTLIAIFSAILDARMQHAKNLIRVEGSVNKIAEQCGYASTSYFIYAFRKHFGNSPKRVSKEYRCQSHTGMNTGNTMNALAI